MRRANGERSPSSGSDCPQPRAFGRGDDSRDVGVYNRHFLAEGNRANRARRVAPDAGQRQNFLEILRENPAMLIHHSFRGGVQIPRA